MAGRLRVDGPATARDSSFRRWFPYHEPAAGARGRLFCVPHAGAGAVTYAGWQHELPRSIELCAAEPPGHWTRAREPSLTSVHELAGELADAMGGALELPFVVFGHSLGALVAFETCRLLRARFGALPLHLVASGRAAPQLEHRPYGWRTMSDSELTDRIQALYTPDEGPLDPALMALLLPSLRADLQAADDYRYQHEYPLECPLLVLGGSHDQSVSEAELRAWSRQTSAAFALRTFSGGHFFTTTHRRAVTQLIASLGSVHDASRDPRKESTSA